MRPICSRKTIKRLLILIFWMTIGIVLLRTLHVDLDQFLLAMRKFSPTSLAIGLIMVLIQFAFQISRLWVLFPPEAQMSWIEAARTFVNGQFFSNFVQTNAGNFVKITLAYNILKARKHQLSIGEVTAIVVVDRVIDIIVLILLATFAATQLSTDFFKPILGVVNFHSIGLVLLGGTVCVLIIGVIVAYSNRIQQIIQGFLKGLAVIRKPKQLGFGFGMDIGDWFAEGYLLYLLCSTQGYSLSIAQIIMSLFIVNVGITVFVSAANLGSLEAALGFALTQMGVPLATAIAIATMFHIFQLLGVSLGMSINLLDRSDYRYLLKRHGRLDGTGTNDQ